MPNTLQFRGGQPESPFEPSPHQVASSSESGLALLDCCVCGHPIKGRVVRLSDELFHNECALSLWASMVEAMEEESEMERSRR
jgi:hypothetical protein